MNFGLSLVWLFFSLPLNAAVEISKTKIAIPGAPLKLTKITMKNSKIQVSVLPEAGGRVYEFVDLQSRKNLFYKNTIWRPSGPDSGWGANSCRKGGWKAIGGMEISFPESEHGCVYDLPFQYKLIEGKVKGVQMWLSPSKDTWGLEIASYVTLSKEDDFFVVQVEIKNPSKTLTKKLQLWLNATLSLGLEDPREGEVELVYPDPVKQVIYHGGSGLQRIILL